MRNSLRIWVWTQHCTFHDFTNMTDTISTGVKRKSKLDFIKIKNCCASKDTIKSVKINS